MSFTSSARARFSDLLGGRFLSQYAGPQGNLVCNNGKEWRNHIPFGYNIAHAILARDLGRDIKIQFFFYTDQKKVLTPSICLIDGDKRVQAAKIIISGKGFKSDFYLNLSDGFSFAGATEVEEAYQGHGLGKHVMRNQIEFIHATGKFKSFHMTAAMSAGGYTWGKFGIEPTDLNTDPGLRNQIQQRHDVIRLLLAEDEVRELAPLIRPSCREDVWALSQSSIELGSRLRPVFSEAHASQSLRRSFTEGVYNRMRARAHEGLPVTAGQFHLAGTRWRGHVNLSDEAQLRRIAAYAGGFQSIKLD